MINLKEMKSIPVEMAADIIGKAPQFIRIGLQQQRLPFGIAVMTSSVWSYHISYEQLKNYIGIDRLNEYERTH